MNTRNVPTLCGRCHSSIISIYRESIHGKARTAGNLNAPTCTGCHGEHRIESPQNGHSEQTIIRLSSEICSSCHDDQRLISKGGLSALRVASYEESYHGMAGMVGSLDAARCASCHGTHNIFRSDDPRSQVYPSNLMLTCGRCHEGINERFAAIRVHAVVSEETTTPAGIVRVLYLLLIFGVVGGMVLHNGIIFSRYLREKYRAQRRVRRARRFSQVQVIQHITLIIGFTLLAMTGFALKYPNSWWVDLLYAAGLNEAGRRLIHRIAAITMIVQSIVQVIWFILARDGRKEIRALIPNYKDILDLIQNIKYHLFRADRPPHSDRFDYAEKVEYLALIWGTLVMAVTGIVLWYPETFSAILPVWGIEVATAIHFYEAVLATLSIFAWHWFFVIYHPREYPMRLTWINGTMTEEDYEHHHPLEYDSIKQDPSALIPPQDAGDGPKSVE